MYVALHRLSSVVLVLGNLLKAASHWVSQTACSAMSGRLPACAMHSATPCTSLRKKRRRRRQTQAAELQSLQWRFYHSLKLHMRLGCAVLSGQKWRLSGWKMTLSERHLYKYMNVLKGALCSFGEQLHYELGNNTISDVYFFLNLLNKLFSEENKNSVWI